MIFLDLTDALLADVRGPTGTAWIPESARVMRSGFYKFFDEPFISAVHLTEKSCPEMADDGLSSFDTNRSRSQVNFQVDSEKPNCALVQPTKGHTMLQLDGTCATEVVAGELVEGFEFEPRCLIVVSALENEKALFDAMMSAGRILTDPLEISINYTIATGSDPDVKIASTNCHNSHVLLRNYELDTTGQAERDELAQVRADTTMYENLIAFTENLINSQALVGPADSWGRVTLLSPKPSPPPPPPPVRELSNAWAPRHPPAPPEVVSGRALVKRYEGMLLDLEAREDELVLKLNDCFVKDRAAGTVCGLSSNEAPHPWMALNGVKCRGYATLSTREMDYCGYWESDTNPMAAESKKERKELLSVGPFCMIDGEEPVLGEDEQPVLDRHGNTVYKQVPAYCSPNATRTQRSGVTDVEYMIRPDREYCEFKFARQRLVSESGNDIELCRANLTARIERCHINCDSCGAHCTSKVAREVISAVRCSISLPILGMFQAQHSSDMGLDIGFRWGAKRYDRRPANPTNSWEEKYRVLVQNSVDAPLAPRNSISCRKPHRESDVGFFHPPLDEEGHPVERKGFHVPCNTDLDCYSRCGNHPVTGMHYVCTHKAQMYTTAGLSKDAYKAQVVISEQLKVAGEPHPKIWLPDSNNEEFYLMDMPGDDRYDIERGTGVCTDVHYDYMHTGCDSIEGARAMQAIAACPFKAMPGRSFLCGILIDVDEDYVHDVGINSNSLIYPRVLVEETQVNGVTQQRITCWNPLDCEDKCNHYARKAHSGGLPSPAACAMCDMPCPNNAAESVFTAIRALGDDIITAIRLAALCLNPTACVCQVFMLLRPAWIDNLPNELQECSAPDIMKMILDKVAVALLGLLETIINGAFVDPINKLLRPIKDIKIPLVGKPFNFIKLLKRLCIPYKDIKDCRSEQELAELAALLGCSWDDKQLWKRCYYERVKSICLADDEMVNGYKDLFQPESQDELMAQYEAIVGDSFEVVDPSMQQLFDGANQEVNEAAQNICGDLTRGSLSLDKAILACVFHFIEEFCPKEEADDNLIINLKTLRWKLDDVVFDWGASPPPPPPVKHGAYEDLLVSDPEGMDIAREKMLEFWPQLSNVAQQTSGANVGRDHSADGLGYGPVYFVSKYSMSTAYLATAHFKDQDALSARIIQARFTGHFRFACQAFLEFMSDPTTAGAGSNNPETSAFGNPDDFASPYDRNWVAMASALFSESYFFETGHLYDTGVHKFWQENCEAPAVQRSAVPTSLWRLDQKVYGEEDLFAHAVPVHNYAPLRAFGSLRQLRDLQTGGDGSAYNEDYTNVADADQFKADRGEHRATNSLQALYRERICNPTYKYSINDAIGNPPIGGNDPLSAKDADGPFIRDASEPKLPRYDMSVPNGMLGASGIRRPHPEGCGLGIESGGCDPKKVPTYYDSSLWSWAYVTSSQCEKSALQTHPRTPTRNSRFPLACAQRPRRCARLAPAALLEGVYLHRVQRQQGPNVQVADQSRNRRRQLRLCNAGRRAVPNGAAAKVREPAGHATAARAAAGLDQRPPQALCVGRRRVRPGRHDLRHGSGPRPSASGRRSILGPLARGSGSAL